MTTNACTQAIRALSQTMLDVANQRLDRCSLSHTEYLVLKVCTERPGSTLPGVARLIQLQPTRTRAIVDGLINRGLLYRLMVGNGTSSPLYITAAGRDLLRPAMVAVAPVEELLLELFGSDAATKFAEACSKLTALPVAGAPAGHAVKSTDSISALNMPLRLRNLLLREGIDTVGRLTSYTAEEMKAVRGIAGDRLGQIEAALGEYGLRLAEPPTIPQQRQ